MYFYYWIGNTLEQYWGTPQFNLYFFSGVVLTIIYGFIMYFITGLSFAMDSYYLYLSMFFSIAVLFPDVQVLFMFIIPVKMKYLAIIDAVFFAISVITNPFPANLLPIVAVLNFFIFCGGKLFSALPHKRGRGTVNFRRESKRIRREQESRLYTHKCSVCGKTDVDIRILIQVLLGLPGTTAFAASIINNHIHLRSKIAYTQQRV